MKISKLLLILVVLLVVGMTTVASADAFETWLKRVAEPYKDVTIRGISESTPPSKTVLKEIVPKFEELTGINVEFEPTSWDAMYTKSVADMVRGSGIYDFVYVEQDIVYSYLQKNWLTDLTKFKEENAGLTWPDFSFDDFTNFIDNYKGTDNGHVFGVPFEAFLKVYTYRKDLFNDPEIKKEFKEEYGWELRPAKTWDEYKQIAKFFYDYGQENDLDLYGHAAQAKNHPCLGYSLVETYWPAVGIYNWGIDLETMRAANGTLNSDVAKEQLQLFIDLLNYAPPAVRTYTWDGVAAAMASGKVAQAMIYGENVGWIGTDSEQSKVVGKIGVALPPTKPGVIEEAEAGEGYIGYYDGGAFAIPYSSKKKEAAWLFLQYVAKKENALVLAEKGSAVTQKSVLNEMVGSDLDKQLDGYFTLMAEKGKLFRGAPPFPFHKLLMEGPYLKWISAAVAGEVSVEEAIEKLTKEVDNNIVKLGY
ncbi:MAG: multiple sugar transport system substrate-binding protein [Halanaerobiales bacterium]|nr:multiple sugar transport system substrate-binding protein [Halanaerobiales bacterium]